MLGVTSGSVVWPVSARSQGWLGAERIAEAEAYTGLSRWTIWRTVREGSLRMVSLGQGRSAAVRYDRRDLARFMQKHKCTECARG